MFNPKLPFKSSLSTLKNSKNADVCENFDSHFTGITNDEINIDFTLQEIVSNIQKLKNNKACGIDYIRN